VTPKRAPTLDLDVDLEGGVVPISKAASSLAALLKRARERRGPIIVTQKGGCQRFVDSAAIEHNVRKLGRKVGFT
jgi:hypothetical protein